jgi:hypothetical protein
VVDGGGGGGGEKVLRTECRRILRGNKRLSLSINLEDNVCLQSRGAG